MTKVIISGVELLELDWSEIDVILVDDGWPLVPTVEVRDYAGLGHVDRDGDEYMSVTFPARLGDELT